MMFRFSNYQNLFRSLLFLGFCLIATFQLKKNVKAVIFQPNEFQINVYGYSSNNHSNRAGMKKADVYLEHSDGWSIKFCPKGNGEYIKCTKPPYHTQRDLNIEMTQPFTIRIEHRYFRNREIYFLHYPFEKIGSVFTFYLFKPENYKNFDDFYHIEGTKLFCTTKHCNSIIDKAVSYYELAGDSLSQISDLKTKKNIIYNLGRAKFNAWEVLHYDTCYQAYDYYSKVNKLLGDNQTDVNNKIKSLLLSDGYLVKDQNNKEIIKKRDDFCKKRLK